MPSIELVEVRRGRDGKLYPARPLAHADRNRARRLAHNLSCRDQLSLREAQRVMAEVYGVRRSVGQIHWDLNHFACGHPRCPCVPAGEPAATQPAGQESQPPATVHQTGSGLPGQLRG